MYLFRLLLLNKLLEDGNTLFRNGRLEEATYRYEYALKRLPKQLKPSTSSEEQQQEVFLKLKVHLLLNLSRTHKKQGNYEAAVQRASEVLEFKPDCCEALWTRAKAKKDSGAPDGPESALADLREALKKSPQNLELHRYTIKVKDEVEKRRRALMDQQQLHQPQDQPEVPRGSLPRNVPNGLFKVEGPAGPEHVGVATGQIADPSKAQDDNTAVRFRSFSQTLSKVSGISAGNSSSISSSSNVGMGSTAGMEPCNKKVSVSLIESV